MQLGAWRRIWLAYDFDRQTGRYTRRLVRSGQHLASCGFGAIERTREHGRVFFCLYRWGGQIHFQIGQRSWPLDTAGLRCTYQLLESGRSSEFNLHQGDELLFRCSYRHWLRARLRRRDEDDNFDVERDHFLAHVASLALPMGDSDAWEDGEAQLKAAAAADAAPPE